MGHLSFITRSKTKNDLNTTDSENHLNMKGRQQRNVCGLVGTGSDFNVNLYLFIYYKEGIFSYPPCLLWAAVTSEFLWCGINKVLSYLIPPKSNIKRGKHRLLFWLIQGQNDALAMKDLGRGYCKCLMLTCLISSSQIGQQWTFGFELRRFGLLQPRTPRGQHPNEQLSRTSWKLIKKEKHNKLPRPKSWAPLKETLPIVLIVIR